MEIVLHSIGEDQRKLPAFVRTYRTNTEDKGESTTLLPAVAVMDTSRGYVARGSALVRTGQVCSSVRFMCFSETVERVDSVHVVD